MAVLTIDLKADGLEQGSFGGVGNVDSPIRVRSINHVALPSDSVDRKFTVSATTSAEGKTLQIEFVGFLDSTTNAYNCDLGWYNSPYTFNLSSYTNTKYVRMLFRYSDDSNITPEEITSCKLSYEVETVYHAHEGEYPINDSAMPIVQTDFTRPFPSNLWRIDQSNDGYPYTDLQLGILTYEPPPPPPPAPTVDPLEFYDEYNAEYLYALRQKHRRYKIRVELLGYYENVVGEITRDVSLGSSGQVTINNEQITRRSCSLNLINVEKKYLPSQDSAIWFNRKFKLWLGIEVGKKTYWWSYGVFYTQKATCNGDTVSIQGVDKGGALDGTIKTGMLDTSCIVEAGTTLTNVIKDTLMWNEFSSPYLNHRTGASAYPVDPITPIISTKFDGIRTQNEITINSNDYISTLFSSIADGYGADAYYNTNGHFCFQVMADENRIDGYRFMAHQWDFSDEDDMYSNASVDFNLDGYNVVTVYTNESDLENVSYTAANNNPASPLRLDSAGIRRMADVEIPYVNVPQSEMQARCKAYADYLLMKEAMQGMSITFSCPIIPHLDVNRTIGITDKRFNLDHATFVVNSITMPLSAEAMTVNATQTSWLPDNTGIEGGGI